MNALVANLSHAIIDPAITPPRLLNRQLTLSLLNYPGGYSRFSAPDSQDSLSFPSLIHRIPTTQAATSTKNITASTDLEEMVKLREDNVKLKNELQTLQSNHDKVNEEFKSLLGLHYQWKLACLWSVDCSKQLALEFDKMDQ